MSLIVDQNVFRSFLGCQVGLAFLMNLLEFFCLTCGRHYCGSIDIGSGLLV